MSWLNKFRKPRKSAIKEANGYGPQNLRVRHGDGTIENLFVPLGYWWILAGDGSLAINRPDGTTERSFESLDSVGAESAVDQAPVQEQEVQVSGNGDQGQQPEQAEQTDTSYSDTDYGSSDYGDTDYGDSGSDSGGDSGGDGGGFD